MVMLKRKRLACLVILLLVLAGVSLHPAVYWRVIGWSRGEAFYQGRPTSYWAEQFRNWPGPEDSWSRSFLPEIIANWFEPEDRPSYPGQAFYSEGRHVVPANAIPVLVELLGEEGEAANFACVGLLVASSEMPQVVQTAVPKIVEILRSPSCKHRQYPIWALGCIGGGAKGAVPALIEVVGEADTSQPEGIEEIYWALGALEEIGPAAREAIPVLEKLRDGEAGGKTIELKNGHVTLRSLAIQAIQKISGE